MRVAVEEQKISRAVVQKQQSAWMRWEQVMERTAMWDDFWQVEPHHIKFLIQVVYVILFTPSSLQYWQKVGSITQSYSLLIRVVEGLRAFLKGPTVTVWRCWDLTFWPVRQCLNHLATMLKTTAEALTTEAASSYSPSTSPLPFKNGRVAVSKMPLTEVLATAWDWKILTHMEK